MGTLKILGVEGGLGEFGLYGDGILIDDGGYLLLDVGEVKKNLGLITHRQQ